MRDDVLAGCKFIIYPLRGIPQNEGIVGSVWLLSEHIGQFVGCCAWDCRAKALEYRLNPELIDDE